MGYELIGGAFLGWALGANDAANVFGTAVAARMLRFGTAAALCSLFVLVGALLEGQAGIETIGALSSQSPTSALLAAVGAAMAITLMTYLNIPASTSQAVVGAIVGLGLISGEVNLAGLAKVAVCWVTTPLGAMVVAMVLYRALGMGLNWLSPSIFSQDLHLRTALILAGCYGAYALGANNVANVTGVYFAAGLLTAREACLVGGLSIAAGILTYSRRVMVAVGRHIFRLDAFSALVVVLAEAIAVHIYAWIGVPVSTSQAVVGAVIGVGLLKQASAVRGSAVVRIAMGWVAAPAIAGLLAAGLHFAVHLRYVAPR